MRKCSGFFCLNLNLWDLGITGVRSYTIGFLYSYISLRIFKILLIPKFYKFRLRP